MKKQGPFTTWLRLLITAALAITVGVAIDAASPASAVVLEDFPIGPDVPTAFELDGNKGTDGTDEAGTGTAFDWDDAIAGTVGPYSFSDTINNVDYESTGIVASTFNTDVQPPVCGGTPNEDGFGGGAKIDDNPWAIITTNVNSKSDACSGATALEIMRVTDNNTGSDQIHYILYTYWTRSLDATGDMTVYQIFLGTNPDPMYRCDDLLFEFNYDPSSGIGEITTLEWTGDCTGIGTWTDTGVQAVAAAITGANVDPADVGSSAANEDTFGESAIDLTASGVLPEDECSTFKTAGYITRTGNSQSGSTIDNFAFTTPITIDTCTDVIISKDANVSDSTAEFTYVLDQLDGATVHNGTLSATGGGADTDGSFNSITSTIGVGEGHTWSGVIAQPDYQLDETIIPVNGWDLVDITCTYYDPFLGGGMQTDVVVTDSTGILDQFVVPPPIADGGKTTTCAITNQTSAVQVAKVGSGDPAADFPFTITDPAGGADVSLQLSGVASPLSLGETSDAFTYTPGTTVTITESVAGGTPGWSLDAIECDGGIGLTVDTAAGTASFDTVGGETITCTFTNNQVGQINVVKDGAGAVAGPFEFATNYGSNFTLNIGEADNSGDLTSSALLPGDYTVDELLTAFNASIAPAPAFVGSASCVTTTPGSDTSSFVVADVNATITLGAGDIVTCTFTNIQDGRIIVDKTSINGDNTFNFTGDLSGSITTVNGATVAGQELSGDFAPGTYTVGETPTAGYTLTPSVCNDGSTPDSIGLAAGEVVTCTFTNTRNEGTFTIDKSWGDADPGEVVNLSASATGPVPIDTAIATTATAPAAAAGDNSMVVYSGQSISFAEAFDVPANADNYTTTLNCNVPVTADPDNRGGTIDVGDTPGDITCTLTNTRKQAGVRLQKVWVDSLAGDTAGLSISVTGGASDSATSTAPNAPTYGGPSDVNDSTAFVAVAAGQTVDLSENLSAGPNYTSEVACTGATNAVTPGAGNRSGSLVIDALDDGNEIICTFTNTRISVDLTVEKDWTNAVGGDVATIATTGADNNVDFVSTAGATGDTEVTETDTDPTTYTVFAGETLNFSEVIAPGDPDAYTTTFSCNGIDSATDEQLTIDPTDGPITCTYDNTRRTLDVRVAKALVPTTDDGLFDLSINATEVVDAGGHGAISAPVTVFVGDSVSLSELADATSPALANYTTTLVCDNGVALDVDNGTDGSFTAPSSLADNAVVICTFENTRKQAPLTVTKDWADSPANDDAVSLVITGGLATPIDGANVNDDPDAGDTDATLTVYAGETITVTEAFTTGTGANYDSTLVCTDAAGDLVPLTTSLTGDVVVPSTPTAITCTFTNTRIRGELTLRKQWVNAAAGDTAALTIAGEDAASPAQATSTAILGNSVDTINTATMTVYAGESVDLDETVTVGANYDSQIICTGSDNSPTGADTSYDLAITPADQGASILCTFLNTRKQITVDLVKDWDTSPANDDAVSLTISNLLPGTNGVDSNDGDDTNDVDATAQALAGETISLTEAFTAGAAENYITSLACLDAAGASVGADLTYAAGALTGDLVIDAADAGTTITCTFTNQRKSTTLNLAKTWVGSVLADEVDLSIAGTDSDPDVLATAPGGDGAAPEAPASITVYAGETVTLSEAIDPNGTNIANYNSSNFACSAGTETPAWVVGDTSVGLLVSAADVDAANLGTGSIDCSFENTAERGTIIVAKSIDGVNDGTFQFSGDWSADGSSITPPTVTDPANFPIETSGLTGAVMFENVLVPKDGAPAYSIRETDPTPAFDGTSVTCSEDVNGDGGSGPIDGTSLPLTGSIDLDEGETVTCTFTNTERSTIIIVKDVRTFDGGPLVSDQSFTFTADYSVDPIVLNDDGGVDAVPNSDTSALLNAENGASYTVTEAAEFGWTLDSALSSCTNGDLFSGTGVTITPAPGTTVTCTFVNTANPAGLTATKTVEGQVGPWGPFEFTLSGGPIAAGETNAQLVDSVDPVASWTELVEGETYTLTETGPVPGYQLGTFTCLVATDGAPGPLADADPGTDGFQFVAVAGAQYGCDITNTALPSDVQVTKTVAGVAATQAWSFDFTLTPAATPGDLSPATGSGNTTDTVSWSGLVPGGTYTIAESTPNAGYSAGALVCSVADTDGDLTDASVTFVAPLGDANDASVTFEVTCEITNTALPSDVQVTKTVAGVDATQAWSFDFTLTPAATPGDLSPATNSGNTSDTVSWSGLVPGGTYTIAETVPNAGYSAGALVCNVADTDGSASNASVTFVAPLGDDNAAGVTFEVTCEITNTALPSDAQVTKTVAGVDASQAWSFAFTLTPTANTVELSPATGSGNTTDTVSWSGLIPGGTYTISETVPNTGYTAGAMVCNVADTDGDLADASVTFVAPLGDGNDAGVTFEVTCDIQNVVSPSDVQVTKTVAGVDATQAWSFDFTLTPTGTPVDASPATNIGNTTDTVSWSGLVPGGTYTIAESTPNAGYSAGALVCSLADTDGDLTDASVTFVAPLGDDNIGGVTYEVTCEIQNDALPSDVQVTKTVAGVDATQAWSFDFTLTPAATPGDLSPATNSGNTSDTVSWSGLVPGGTYTIAETTPTAGYTAGAMVCNVADIDGDLNDAAVTFIAPLGDLNDAGVTYEVTCEITNTAIPSDIEITKTVDGGLLAGVPWSFDFTIDAVPAGETSPKTAAGSGSTSETVGWSGLVPGTTYTVAEVTPNAGYTDGVLTCSGAIDQDQNDLSVTFIAPLGGDGVEVSCSITNTAQSDVTWDKVVDGAPVRDPATGIWTINYLLTVENAADAGTGVYDLADTFNFGDGVSIVDGTAAVTNTAPGTIVTNALFDGVTETDVVLGESIEPDTAHTYTVTVQATLAVGPDTDGDCIRQPGEGSGFLNAMTISVDGGDPEITEACDGFATLTLVKDISNDDGGNATIADFPLTAVGPATLTGVSGTADVSSAVPAGSYALSEEELVDGYLNLGWACTGAATSTSDSVTLLDGEQATCTIINDDEPVDLEITKNDDGITAIAGGAPFDYTITVQNIGTRDVDLSELVTVTDELPAGLSWLSFPANCVQSGQTLTCNIEPTLLPFGGTPIVITVTVEADADAVSGTYVNHVSVTTDDDPVCVGVDCVPPPCDQAVDNNNVDCEETPVDRQGAIQILKTDDVADGVAVEPGGTYSYSLLVTNTGVSTILPGLVVTDDLPAQVGLVSAVGGAGWTCNSVDPIECTYAPALAPGASAPAITVTVDVAETASGTAIVNVAEVIGAVDRDCASDPLIEAFEPACNEVTDDDDEATPLNPNADLAIVKTASVAQVGAGGGFDWVLEITNNGPGTAVNVEIGDIVPSELAVTGVTSSDFSCSNSGNTVTCTKASMAVGASGTLTIAVSTPATADGGTVINVGTVDSDTPDPDLTNNSDDASVIIVAQAPPTTTLPPVTLPKTGSDATGGIVQAAFLLFLLGGVIVLAARRRRDEELHTVA